MSQQTPSPPAPPKASRKKLVMLLAAVVILGGGGAYWTFVKAPAAPHEPPPEPPAYLVLDPFVVNLADEGGRRFLRLTLGIVVEGEKPAKAFGEDAVTRMRVRSELLELLARQTSEVLVTPEGKAALKATIAERIASNAEQLKVSDVLFSEFIVQ